jgi:xanthine dehydrogenase YagS FAD-binding subunit
MVLRSTNGERVLDAADYFIGPGTDIMRMNVLRPGELLTAIRIPGDWAGSNFYFEKVRDRQVWDFALVSVASAMTLSGDTIQNMRLVVNAVAARPLRLVTVEQFVKGRPRNEETAAAAGDLAVQGTQPLRFNAYKVPLMRNLVKRAIRGVEQWATS